MEPVTLQAAEEPGWAAVRLRPITEADIDDITQACQDPDTQRYTVIPIPYTRADAETFLQIIADGWAAGTNCILGVDLDGRWAGSIDLRPPRGDVGYAIAPWARRRGLGSSALRTICRWGFDELNLNRITWEALQGNWPSRRMAERVGFRYTGDTTLEHRGEQLPGWTGELLPTDLR